MKMSLSTSKLSYPEPTREFFSAFKTTNPGQPFCSPANFLQRQVMNHSSNPSLIPGQAGRGGREPVLCSQLRGWAGLGWGRGWAALQGGLRPVSALCATRNTQTGLGLTSEAVPSAQVSSLEHWNGQASGAV